MAENILKFQCGREAAISGQRRDGRMSADWLEGFDQESGSVRTNAVRGADRKNYISPGEKVFRDAERAAVVAWLRDEAGNWDCEVSLALKMAAQAIERGQHRGGK